MGQFKSEKIILKLTKGCPNSEIKGSNTAITKITIKMIRVIFRDFFEGIYRL